MRLIPFAFLLVLLLNACSVSDKEKNPVLLSVDQYKEDVYASWLGQLVGNSYGLSYEFKFVEEAGPDSFPYGYGWTLDLLKEHNGAFSDDDTDIEYMYLLQMEEHGIEPNYFQLAEAWKKHVKEKVWCANRAAVTLMHAGHYPPVTGSADYNTQWMQIDPQLVNEIWAVTAPGMIDYAVEKSAFAARITNDSFGIEPTLHYAAMYSAAFFEKDLDKLIQIGNDALPPENRFSQVVNYAIQLHDQYPDNWQQARQLIKEKYLIYADYNKYAWPPIDAQLNGALGILSLLYGEGDFQKTLDFACALGMDADNQAATMCGLLGIVNGLSSIPEELLYPIPDRNWSKPFNDRYKMLTREGLEDASIIDMAERMALQGEKIILDRGGKILEKEGKKYYSINPKASFQPPFELNPVPPIVAETKHEFTYPLYTGIAPSEIQWSMEGEAPEGISIKDNLLFGHIEQAGHYNFQLVANSDKTVKSIPLEIHVFEKNLAPSAQEILFNKEAKNHDLELIRDGRTDRSYYSEKEHEKQALDYYGYLWDQEVSISALLYNNGIPGEFCGWFTSFDVEMLRNGEWEKISPLNMNPKMNLDNNQWLKGHKIDYLLRFDSVKTKGIRIIGLAGGIEKDANNAHLGMQYYSAISELKVY